jgi:hypothetical protein
MRVYKKVFEYLSKKDETLISTFLMVKHLFFVKIYFERIEIFVSA